MSLRCGTQDPEQRHESTPFSHFLLFYVFMANQHIPLVQTWWLCPSSGAERRWSLVKKFLLLLNHKTTFCFQRVNSFSFCSLLISEFFFISGGANVGAVIAAVIILTLIVALAVWFTYAYTHPNSTSGIWLIEVRTASHWKFSVFSIGDPRPCNLKICPHCAGKKGQHSMCKMQTSPKKSLCLRVCLKIGAKNLEAKGCNTRCAKCKLLQRNICCVFVSEMVLLGALGL